MPVLKLKLIGPMQAWGTASRFDHRGTQKEPSKSAILGLLCAALGIDRAEWAPLAQMCNWPMAVRVDREGLVRTDYHTVTQFDRKGKEAGTSLTSRDYLADAAFLVLLEADADSLAQVYAALQNPHWTLSLGRKAFVPSEPIYYPTLAESIAEESIWDALQHTAWLVSEPTHRAQQTARVVCEVAQLPEAYREQGTRLYPNDVPSAAFSQRQFIRREVCVLQLTKPEPVVADVEAS